MFEKILKTIPVITRIITGYNAPIYLFLLFYDTNNFQMKLNATMKTVNINEKHTNSIFIRAIFEPLTFQSLIT